MSLGFGIASPLAAGAMAATFVFLVRSPPYLGRRLTIVAPVVIGALVLFVVGIPIDLWHSRRTRERTASTDAGSPLGM
ncbi:MAG: hypothetical protein JWL61_1669 [Gemmatimonadetes bacterium]|nr:hypothetical protein [Gemmatimonadota bacterium]